LSHIYLFASDASKDNRMAETDQPQRKGVTRHLNLDHLPSAPPRIDTRPLDYIMPWVIEFRVVGTPSVIQVRVKESMIIGRSDPDRDVRPDIDLEPYNAYMKGVSREHAIIVAGNNRVAIQDLNSANGTFLNNGRLEPGAQYRLHHGDRLALGGLELQVLFVVMPSSQEESDEEGETPSTPPSDAQVPVMGSGQHVLVIDDDKHVAQTIGDVLTEVGFRTTVVDNVTDALFMVAEELPYAIVLELMLPGGSGLDLIKYVRSREDGQDLPLMVVSSASGGYQMGQAIDAGANIFLKKPLGIDDFVNGFSQILPQPDE
jgi:CheY-like chemotaxis protein